MIDLHTHTTASDGRCSPTELVARAAAAGVRILSITDHDTVAGHEEAVPACRGAGIAFVPGIEITAVRDETDVHVLGYFIDAASPALQDFLLEQRQLRIARVRLMIEKLAAFGIRLDADTILQPALADPRRSAGRPWIARALVSGGHVATTNEAFERWLARGKQAFVPRLGAAPEDVIARVHDARGIASIAHPGPLGHDEWMGDLVINGLDAIEAYHSTHDAAATAHYLALATHLGVAVTGGSDYHADDVHGAPSPGSVSLPHEPYERLVRWATMRATDSGSLVSS